MFSYASIMLENHFLIFSIVCSFHLVNIYSFIKVNVYSIDITDGIRLRYYMNAEKVASPLSSMAYAIFLVPTGPQDSSWNFIVLLMLCSYYW